jgi:hypothetical protein
MNIVGAFVRPGQMHQINQCRKYMFQDESGLNCIGPEAFFRILAQSGASMQYASQE